MGGTKGYRSYRGRVSKGRVVLIVVLVLVILASVAVIWLQDYVVYDEDGRAHVVLPWQELQPAEEETPPQNVEVTIQEPEQPELLAAFSVSAASLTQSAWQEAEAAIRSSCRAADPVRLAGGADSGLGLVQPRL